jgi:anti-sigma regulatory factor (Ser/Thr protein kinase)
LSQGVSLCSAVDRHVAVPTDVWRTASGPPGRSISTVGVFTDGHGRAAPAACSGLTCADESGVYRLCPPRPVVSGAGGRREGGALVTEVAVRESVTVAGRPERARVARAFVGGVLGPGHPCGADAALLVSELFGNSVRHGGSGAAGEMVTVMVRAGDGVVRVEVTDCGGPGVPRLHPADRDAEGGRGLQLVAGMAARWGWRRHGGRMVTWFELSHG